MLANNGIYAIKYVGWKVCWKVSLAAYPIMCHAKTLEDNEKAFGEGGAGDGNRIAQEAR